MIGARLVSSHLRATDEALMVSSWASANHDARRILRRAYQRYPWTRGMFAIAPQQLANYVQTTLSVGMTNVATTATLSSVAGLPTIGNFRLRIDDVAPATTFEIVEVSAVNVGTGVVTFSGGAGVGRGLEGTTAIAHNAGAIVGNDLTAAMLQLSMAMGALGYAQVVANQGGITAAVDLTSLTVTITPIAANRRLRITGYIQISSTVGSDSVALYIMEGATQLQNAPLGAVTNATTAYVLRAEAIVTPTLAAHTYKLQAARTLGTGTVTMSASATTPAFILVEDIGQA